MKLYIDGIERFVAVDDYIPMSKGWVQALDGSWHDSWVPVYAKSRIYGEIWPEIAEKVWAKVYGSYAAMGNGGLNS